MTDKRARIYAWRPNDPKSGARRPSPFTLLVAAACLVSLVPGLYTILGLERFDDGDTRLAVAIVELLFAFLCMALLLQVRNRGSVYPSAGVFITALGGLSLFLAYEGGSSLVWSILFPPVAAFALGPRKGLYASLSFGAVVVLVLALAGASGGAAGDADLRIAVAVVFMILTSFSAYSGFRLARTQQPSPAPSQRDPEPAGEAASPRPVGLSAAIEDAGLGAADVVVLYRAEAMQTMSSLPSAEAVASYIVLEGLSDTLEGAPNPLGPADGAYAYRTLSLDDLLAKAESIIEAREAKKQMEFNKIHAQIDAALSPSGEPADGGGAGFDRVCAEYNLSEREAAVARCILKGLSNKEISTELYISIDTVKTHVKNLFKKCEINNRMDFIKLFSRL